jgi:hypothetical protein
MNDEQLIDVRWVEAFYDYNKAAGGALRSQLL